MKTLLSLLPDEHKSLYSAEELRPITLDEELYALDDEIRRVRSKPAPRVAPTRGNRALPGRSSAGRYGASMPQTKPDYLAEIGRIYGRLQMVKEAVRNRR